MYRYGYTLGRILAIGIATGMFETEAEMTGLSRAVGRGKSSRMSSGARGTQCVGSPPFTQPSKTVPSDRNA